MQRLEIKSTMTRVAMTLVMMLLTTMTAWAQDAIDGLTYNTSGGYYEIKDAQDLIDLANYVKGGGDTYGKTFKQTANITFEHTSDWNDTSSGERNFEGIGDFFKGDYYGQGFTISGLRMSYGHGIFYCAYGAIIDGIVLADSRITNNENVGGIVGYTYENIEKDSKPAIVNNCHVRSDVLIHNASGAKAFKIGGVVGHNAKYCQVTNCTSSATITGRTAGGRRESIGGIVGENRGTVSNNFAFDVTIGNIDSYYGAIVGENIYLAILSNNYYFNCTVSGRTSNIGCDGADVTTDNGAYNLSPAHFEQTGTNEYTIHSAVGWEVFCDMLANSDKGYFTGKTVKLDNDIQISRAAGLDQHDFTGTFDGQGNTIKLAFGTSQNRYTEHAAVFRNTEWASSEQYAKIQNLNVNGTIYTASNVIYDAGLVAKAFGGLEISNCTSDVIINTSNQFAGGFVGYNQGKLDIVNCRSNATIYSTVNGDGTHGGFVGNHHSGELTIEGCVFTGKLLTTATNSTAYCGGFVGWCNTATTIKNCLYAPAIIDTEHGETEVQAGTGDYTSCTFGRKSTATVTVTNSYYTRTLGTAQGKAARSITAGDYVTIEAVSPIGSSVENGTYTVSGITAYAKGITRGDAFYYGNGDEVSLTLNHAEPSAGYTFTGYSASAGTLDGTTLTMPDEDVTINATFTPITFSVGVFSYECTSGTEVKMTACDNSLTSVTIPATVTDNNVTYSVTAIAADAFSGCTALTTVFMQPTTPPTLGNNAFYACDELANIYVPTASLDDYKAAWTDYASKIQGYDGTCGTNVYWSYNSKSHKLTIFGTGDMADYNTQPWADSKLDITTVNIGNGVTSIGQHAFAGCTSLTTVFMEPTTPPTLSNNAFYNCDQLTNIYVPAGTAETYKTTGNWATYKDIIQTGGTCGDNVNWSYNSDSKTLTIFGTGAMADFSWSGQPWNSAQNEITTIVICNGVTSIGNNAFASYWGLTSIEIPASVTTIGNAAFNTCIYLTSINIPANVTTIGNEAFGNCTGLTSINIPASVTSIGYWAFMNCIGLESISVAEGNTVYDSRNGCNALIETASNTLMLGCKNTVIPNTVTSIGDDAFYGCEELKEITIPTSVTSIGNYAFYGCSALESISVANGNTKYDSRNDCNALIETASNTLMQGCKNTVIPNTVTSIGDYAFHGCEELKEITIPASVTSIGNETFYYCTGLTSITIPASVTSIGNWAFAYCTSLTTVIMQPTTPPTLGYYAFDECDELDAIYVPAGTSDAYKAAWKDYASKIKGLDEITEIALVDNAYNSDLITGVNSLTLNVTLQGRKLYKDGDWNTLCLPFDVTIANSPLAGDNMVAMTLNKETSGLSGTTLTLNFDTAPATIPAGTPFIIKWATKENPVTDLTAPVFTGVTIDNTDRSVTSSDGYVTFKGTYDRKVWNEESQSILFVGAGNTLYWPQPSNNQTPYLNACRAYFQLNNGLTAAEVSSARMNFDGDGNEVNGVKEVIASLGVNDDSWYTLNGVKLSGKPTKAGLYIHNGKKVIIK